MMMAWSRRAPPRRTDRVRPDDVECAPPVAGGPCRDLLTRAGNRHLHRQLQRIGAVNTWRCLSHGVGSLQLGRLRSPCIVTRTDAPACAQVPGILRHMLKLARTIAASHLAEAQQYRPRVELGRYGIWMSRWEHEVLRYQLPQSQRFGTGRAITTCPTTIEADSLQRL